MLLATDRFLAGRCGSTTYHLPCGNRLPPISLRLSTNYITYHLMSLAGRYSYLRIYLHPEEQERLWNVTISYLRSPDLL